MKFIIGLGNPGKKYEYTRHNLGMRVVKEIAKNNKVKFRKKWLSKTLMALCKIDSEDVKLIYPLIFMNLSGYTVNRLVKTEKMDLVDLLVICDDINLKLGKIRIRPSGTDGGHNGLKSIIQALGTKHFPRIRIGIGRPDNREQLSNFVLSDLTRKEESELTYSIEMAQDCCETWLKEGIAVAMSKFN